MRFWDGTCKLSLMGRSHHDGEELLPLLTFPRVPGCVWGRKKSGAVEWMEVDFDLEA